MLSKSAVIHLVTSPKSKDIQREIEMLKGWYGYEPSRGRDMNYAGLRKRFASIFETRGELGQMVNPSKTVYLDTGIHAPASHPNTCTASFLPTLAAFTLVFNFLIYLHKLMIRLCSSS